MLLIYSKSCQLQQLVSTTNYKATQTDFIDNTDIMHKLQTAHSLNG